MAIILDTNWYLHTKHPFVVFQDAIAVAPEFGTGVSTQKNFISWANNFNRLFGETGKVTYKTHKKTGIKILFVDEPLSLFAKASLGVIRALGDFQGLVDGSIISKTTFTKDDLAEFKRIGAYKPSKDEDADDSTDTSEDDDEDLDEDEDEDEDLDEDEDEDEDSDEDEEEGSEEDDDEDEKSGVLSSKVGRAMIDSCKAKIPSSSSVDDTIEKTVEIVIDTLFSMFKK